MSPPVGCGRYWRKDRRTLTDPTHSCNAVERAFLNALRVVVLRTKDANTGMITREKQQALRSAQRLLQMAQADVVDVWLREEAEELTAEIVAEKPSHDSTNGSSSNVIPFPDPDAPDPDEVHDSAGEEYTDA